MIYVLVVSYKSSTCFFFLFFDALIYQISHVEFICFCATTRATQQNTLIFLILYNTSQVNLHHPKKPKFRGKKRKMMKEDEKRAIKKSLPMKIEAGISVHHLA